MKRENKSQISSTINYLIVNGLLGWILVLLVNVLVFCFALMVSQASLPYALGFFAISVIGQWAYLTKRR